MIFKAIINDYILFILYLNHYIKSYFSKLSDSLRRIIKVVDNNNELTDAKIKENSEQLIFFLEQDKLIDFEKV